MINYDLKIFRILDLDQQLIRLVNSISKNCHQSDKAAEKVENFRYRFPLDCPTPVGIDADSKSEHPKRLQNLFQRRFRRLEISDVGFSANGHYSSKSDWATGQRQLAQ